MRKRRVRIWRKMQTQEYYPGQYSVSNADFLHFNANVEFVANFEKEENIAPLRVVYRVDGDTINIAYFHDIGEGIEWLKSKLEKAIADNKAALESGKDAQIEDT